MAIAYSQQTADDSITGPAAAELTRRLEALHVDHQRVLRENDETIEADLASARKDAAANTKLVEDLGVSEEQAAAYLEETAKVCDEGADRIASLEAVVVNELDKDVAAANVEERDKAIRTIQAKLSEAEDAVGKHVREAAAAMADAGRIKALAEDDVGRAKDLSETERRFAEQTDVMARMQAQSRAYAESTRMQTQRISSLTERIGEQDRRLWVVIGAVAGVLCSSAKPPSLKHEMRFIDGANLAAVASSSAPVQRRFLEIIDKVSASAPPRPPRLGGVREGTIGHVIEVISGVSVSYIATRG
ncbi:hypothetical protein MFIFM68171_02564 [Madurella fahalii]|uniref:Uncharacterized protein n=1 Tax=Madurella fahalii TaxID=1157608 RepID=A0ABQ0G3Q7_9PEZI